MKNFAVKRLTPLPMSMATPNYHEFKKIPMIMIKPEIELFRKHTSPIPLRMASKLRMKKF